MNTGFKIAYAEWVPIVGVYPHRFYTRDDGTVTGTMPTERFAALKESIREDGIINPIIVEWMFAEVAGVQGHVKQLAVSVGNNRVEAMRQLGIEGGPVLYVVPDYITDRIKGPAVEIVQDSNLLSNIRRLWREVWRADLELGYADAWSESGTLQTLVRATLPEPNNFLPQSKRK